MVLSYVTEAQYSPLNLTDPEQKSESCGELILVQ